MQPAGGGPDWNEQGGPPGKGKKKKKGGKGAGEKGGEADDAPPKKKNDFGPPADDAADARLRSAFLPLVDDAAQRIAAAEIRTLKTRRDKAGDDRERYLAWASEWYAGDRRQLATKTLAPLIAGWQQASGRQVELPEAFFALPANLAATRDVPLMLALWSAQFGSAAGTITLRAHQIAIELESLFFPPPSALGPSPSAS